MGAALTYFLRIAALVLAIAPRANADAIVLHPRRPRPEPLQIDPALPTTTRDYYSIGAALGVGEFWSDRDELRAEFARNGFEQPSNVTLAPGFVLTFVFAGPRLELGGAIGIQNVESARSEASLETTFVWANLGHDLWRHGHTAFFGFFGVGVDEVKVGLDTSAPPLLAEQMTGIGGKIDIWRNAGHLQAGIGFEHIFPFEKHQSSERTSGAGLSVSARVGYRSAFSDGNWGNPDHDFAGGPRLGAQGAFALVTMGVTAARFSHGTCEERCRAPRLPGTELTCGASQCEQSCRRDRGDCDGSASNGCETELNTTANCGGCGVGCTIRHGYPSCTRGACLVAACHPGFLNCDERHDNGCETRIEEDVRHCGACDRPCAAGTRCLAGSCRP